MLSYRGEDASLEENAQAMKEALSGVKSAAITKAVRDSHINGEQIRQGEFLGILEDDIVVHGSDMEQIVAFFIGTDGFRRGCGYLVLFRRGCRFQAG